MTGQASTTPVAAPSRVLVVDDETKNRELLRAALEAQGYDVEEAASGSEALTRIAAAAPDLMLLDVAMPGMDGLTVCRALKGDPRTASLPVILVTAQVDRQDRLAGIEAGANDYLPKPVDLPDLVLRVRNAVTAKRLADDVRDALQRLRHLEHLRDSLTHMIVHDMRSPLSAISISLELLQSGLAGAGRADDLKLVAISLASAQQIGSMINCLLDVSRLEAGEMPLRPEDVDLSVVVRNVLDSQRPVAATRNVTLSSSGESCTARCDPEITHRILGNFVTNALKFTPAGGEVRVSLAYDGAHARVTVRDTGVGIAPENHASIFEKFRQVHARDASSGTGLGLHFCKLAIEAHGGRVGVESALGAGSTFWFTLPVA